MCGNASCAGAKIFEFPTPPPTSEWKDSASIKIYKNHMVPNTNETELQLS